MLKRPKLPNGFQGRVFKGDIGVRAAGCVIFFGLVGGEKVTGLYFRNLNNQPSGSNQSGVYMLVLSV